jgi:phosphopentomutase
MLGMFSGLTLLPAHLRRHGKKVAIVCNDIPAPQLVLARTLLGVVGVNELIPGGFRPDDVAARAVEVASRNDAAFTVLYLNDCDRAGHAEGWMSPRYLSEAARLDDGIAVLAPLMDRTDTLVIIVADHGGGGIVPHDHEGDHPLNLRIPLILAGTGIQAATRSQRPVGLLDVPPTILAALGVSVPANYEGRILTEAFREEAQAVA